VLGTRIIRGDCLAVLRRWRTTERPQCIFADPPYNQGVDYGQGANVDRLPAATYVGWLRRWLQACAGVLHPAGSLWVLLPDQWVGYAAVWLTDECGMVQRNWIKWYETFGVNCTHKFNRCSRHLLYYVKDARNFTFNADAVRTTSARQRLYNDRRANPAGKVMDDVWVIPRVAGTHGERVKWAPTQVPLELVRRVVACSTKPGALVLDPFSGTGTTGVVCKQLRRRYVGIEMNARYCALSIRRIRELRW